MRCTLALVLVALVAATACHRPEVGLRLPDAPTNLVATPGDGRVTISFQPGDDGGSPVTNHLFTLDEGAAWTPIEPATVDGPATITGLPNGVPHAARLRGGTGEDEATALAESPASDRLLVAGGFARTASFDGAPHESLGGTDVFVTRLAADGSW